MSHHRQTRPGWHTTEAQGQTTTPLLEERGPSRRRRRRPFLGAKRRAAVAPVTEPTSYAGQHRAEGDAR